MRTGLHWVGPNGEEWLLADDTGEVLCELRVFPNGYAEFNSNKLLAGKRLFLTAGQAKAAAQAEIEGMR